VCAGGVFGAARIVALYYCVCVRVYTRARMCAGMCVGVYVCGCVCVCVFVCMCGKNRSPVLSCTSPPELLCTPLPRIIVHFTPRIIMHTTPQNYRAHHFPVLLLLSRIVALYYRALHPQNYCAHHSPELSCHFRERNKREIERKGESEREVPLPCIIVHTSPQNYSACVYFCVPVCVWQWCIHVYFCVSICVCV